MIRKELSDEVAQERRGDTSNNPRKDEESITVSSGEILAINGAAHSIISIISDF